MDPDGLSILCLVVASVAALACGYACGACCADDTQKEHITRLGFSDRAAGVCVAFLLVCAFFVWSALRLWPAWGMALGVVVLVVCSVLMYSLGGLRSAKKVQSFSAGTVLGVPFTAPAKLAFRLLGLSAQSDVTEQDLLSMVDDVEEQELIDESQKEMITNIFELDDVTAGDIMTHRTEIVAVQETATASEVVQKAVDEGVSRMPVYRKSMDDIVGIICVKDLFSIWNDGKKGDRAVAQFMRTAMFVPESCRARELLVDFKLKHTQIAVVVDEYGGTSGLVTMEDILEEIVGNIQDEFDDEEEDLVPCEGGYLVSGSADLDDVFEAFELESPAEDEADFDTVSGLVLDKLGRIPEQPGESVSYGGLDFAVLAVGERRIEKVKCTRTPPAEPEAEAAEKGEAE